MQSYLTLENRGWGGEQLILRLKAGTTKMLKRNIGTWGMVIRTYRRGWAEDGLADARFVFLTCRVQNPPTTRGETAITIDLCGAGRAPRRTEEQSTHTKHAKGWKLTECCFAACPEGR